MINKIAYHTINDPQMDVINSISIAINTNIYNFLKSDDLYIKPREIKKIFNFKQYTGPIINSALLEKLSKYATNKLKQYGLSEIVINIKFGNVNNAINLLKNGRVMIFKIPYKKYMGGKDSSISPEIPLSVGQWFPICYYNGSFVEINPYKFINKNMDIKDFFNDNRFNCNFSEDGLVELFEDNVNSNIIKISIIDKNKTPIKSLNEYGD